MMSTWTGHRADPRRDRLDAPHGYRRSDGLTLPLQTGTAGIEAGLEALAAGRQGRRRRRLPAAGSPRSPAAMAWSR
jgi:hypothetical protein